MKTDRNIIAYKTIFCRSAKIQKFIGEVEYPYVIKSKTDFAGTDYWFNIFG